MISRNEDDWMYINHENADQYKPDLSEGDSNVVCDYEEEYVNPLDDVNDLDEWMEMQRMEYENE